MGAAPAGDEELAAAVAGREERILVSVRIRPLNPKEIEKGDSSDWECASNTTVVFKHALPNERNLFPTSYTFDRVFGSDANTRQVYEEGAKEVALSVVSGINSSIFAYGQTSSGKTYTMTGITDYSVSDIYQYIHKHTEREFVLKFSAMEIYNEAVRDLLSIDTTPLRLLDDPDKGTIVEKLMEETLRDHDHLRELLSICEAQRQIGETQLNEVSSRSHQILRLTIESSNKVFTGRDSASTLVACVNFVDLAGSERASQALSAGMRLKEGCHINRSLLTLGTVIRKLSKGGRNGGHVPYRDSKLTRILQPALGGNARTAIICTMSPAHTHVEQSRNTLLFASCAKEVVTNARVNLVMSDKALVKHLQRELARLEGELKVTGSGDCGSHVEALKEKDVKIRKLENELRHLMQERDMAQSRLDDLLRSSKDDSSKQWDSLSRTSGTHARTPSSEVFSNSDTYIVPFQDRLMSSPDRNDSPHEQPHCKEVQCIEPNHHLIHRRSPSDDFSILLPEDTESLLPLTDADKLEKLETSVDSKLMVRVDQDQETESESFSKSKTVDIFSEPRGSVDSVLLDDVDQKRFAEEDFVRSTVDPVLAREIEVEPRSLSFSKKVNEKFNGTESGSESESSADSEMLPVKTDQEIIFKTVDKKIDGFKISVDSEFPTETLQEKNNNDKKDKIEVKSPVKPNNADVAKSPQFSSGSLTRSRSCKASMMMTSAYDVEINKDQNTPPDNFYKEFEVRPERVRRSLYTESNVENLDDRLSLVSSRVSEENEEEKGSEVGVEGEKQFAQNQYAKQIDSTRRAMSEDMSTLLPPSAAKPLAPYQPSLSSIAGSPSRWPAEFERRQQQIVDLWHACNVSLVHRTYFFLLFNGDPADSIYMEVEMRRLGFLERSFETNGSTAVTSSLKSLKREREMLYRQMLKKLNTQERESVYTKWGISLSSKQRRLQLAKLVWTKTEMEHVRDSASLVSNLIGLLEPGRALKEMFELSFAATPLRTNRRSFSWKNGGLD
ncbi:hypothetical protein LUZ60_011841 [Juncus effusus]|nr:hypothetical protein LUZ60_011841 [Juncus effusus]